MNKINFSKNWNNKLNNKYFTSIRLNEPSKKPKYLNHITEVFSIQLNNKEYCKARLIDYTFIKLEDLHIRFLDVLDSGLDSVEFYELMEEIYKDSNYWDDKDSEMVVLLFERDDAKLLSASDIYYSIPNNDEKGEFDKKQFIKVS